MTSVDALRDGSFSLGDFRDTKTLHLRADASGNVRLNQYVVIKDLGQGAFGKVKLCLNTQTNRASTAGRCDASSARVWRAGAPAATWGCSERSPS